MKHVEPVGGKSMASRTFENDSVSTIAQYSSTRASTQAAQ